MSYRIFHRRVPRWLIGFLLALCWAALPSAGQGQTVPPDAVQAQPDAKSSTRSAARETTGKQCLFIGHSFFIPVARMLPKQATESGVQGHAQQLVFAGGANGSPGKLWQNEAKRSAIQKTLDAGDVELLGMTYFSPANSSLKDYRKWIDYALEKNPETDFFIGMPWGLNGPSRSVEAYASQNTRAQKLVYDGIVKELRELYPNSRFYWINYGRVAVDLKRAFADKSLPMVEKLVARQDADAIFRDKMGHAAPLTLEMASLVWLSVLYEREPADCTWRYQGKEPLEAILKKIVETQKTYNQDAAPAK
ncbi:MAG: hypothetical protein MK108_07160 [Mariniblastus sp.]|nr:hypothetical protein [Mariniblastus sp.]